MSSWRDKYRVHPAADVFPMMSDEELDALAKDIKKMDLTSPIVFWVDDDDNEFLIDGRNRLEAMERCGVEVYPEFHITYEYAEVCDPVAYVISANINRRHLTKQQQAELIVAAHKAASEAPRQLGEVPKERHVKGKVGSEKDEVKAAIVADAGKHGISERTVERAIAKVEGRLPAKPERYVALSAYAGQPLNKPLIDAARRHYLDLCADPSVNLDKERDLIHDAFREIQGKRLKNGAGSAMEELPSLADDEPRPPLRDVQVTPHFKKQRGRA